eukprot:3239560-Amphidinium_carterae.1
MLRGAPSLTVLIEAIRLLPKCGLTRFDAKDPQHSGNLRTCPEVGPRNRSLPTQGSRHVFSRQVCRQASGLVPWHHLHKGWHKVLTVPCFCYGLAQ